MSRPTSRCSRYPVVARLMAGPPCEGTLLIERAVDLVHVRRKRSHRLYTVTLAEVAEFVVHRVIRRELAEKRAARAARRKRR